MLCGLNSLSDCFYWEAKNTDHLGGKLKKLFKRVWSTAMIACHKNILKFHSIVAWKRTLHLLYCVERCIYKLSKASIRGAWIRTRRWPSRVCRCLGSAWSGAAPPRGRWPPPAPAGAGRGGAARASASAAAAPPAASSPTPATTRSRNQIHPTAQHGCWHYFEWDI